MGVIMKILCYCDMVFYYVFLMCNLSIKKQPRNNLETIYKLPLYLG